MKKNFLYFVVALLAFAFACTKKEDSKPVPNVDFTSIPAVIGLNQEVAFINNSTNATSYQWDFGTDDVAPSRTSTQANPVGIRFTKVGNYTVKLTATGEGGTRSAEKQISVVDLTAEVEVDFTFNPASPVFEGTEIQFINNTLNAVSFSWDFGSTDITIVSGSATARNPRVKFNKAGTYSIKLTATNPRGSKEKTATLEVKIDLSVPIVLQGDLTTQTLDPSRRYLLRGQVVIRRGVTLTIPAGTVVFGEKATKGGLIVDRGGKLFANGTATNPVVFTSNQEEGARDKGDWLGILMLGEARTNQANPSIEGLVGFNFGGNNDADNSGSLTYVRIEFAGIEFTPNNETNSLTMGGVGSGTKMEYIQLSYGGDDGFEWFGGNVDGKWLISFGMWDDDFDCDFGWTGKVQFGLAVRYPSFADQSGSVFFEVDNDAQGSTLTPFTAPVFSNMTLIGPRHLNELRTTPSDATTRTRSQSSINANFTQALHLRRNSEAGIYNSIFTGYPNGLRIDDASTLTKYEAATVYLANNYLIMPNGTNFLTNISGKTGTDVQNVWNKAGSNNVLINPNFNRFNDVVTVLDSLGLRTTTANPGIFFGSRLDINYPEDPDFTVAAGKPLRSGASFTNSKLNVDFFNKNITYIGAFGDSDWTNGWTQFRPKTVRY